MDYQVFFLNFCELVLSNDTGADDESYAKLTMELGGTSFVSVNQLKDRGNALFKDGQISTASLHYKLALQFLCFLGLPPLSDQPKAFSCAISTLLNLAFCELKLKHYDKVLLICSFVLTFEPSNAKALYRRGLASKQLHSLPDALYDFESASRLDPSNKDISRELSWVVEELALNTNGKRHVLPFDPLPSIQKGKKPHLNYSVFNKCTSPSGNNGSTSYGERNLPPSDPPAPIMSQATSPHGTTDKLPVEFMEVESSCERAETSHNISDTTSKPPFRTFTKKKQPHNMLYLSSQDYDNLLNGKNLGFFHHRSMSFMRVRPLISKTIQTGTPQDEIFGSAEVPSSPQLSQEKTKSSECSVSSIHNDRVVQEEVVVQVTKKKRVSFVSSQVSAVSETHFQFDAVRENENGVSRRKKGYSRPVCSATKAKSSLKKRSLVAVDFSFSLCRSIKDVTVSRSTKRKDANFLHFDTFCHRPRKKIRRTVLVSESCTVSSVCCFPSNVVLTPVSRGL